MNFVIVFVILTLVVMFVTWPLRQTWKARPAGAAGSSGDAAADAIVLAELAEEIDELDAAREAKYREIRDAEMDHETGKLSDDDFRFVDDALRAEAIEILKALDSAHEQQL